MKKEDIADAMGNIREEYIISAEKTRKKNKRPMRKRIIALAACLCLIVTGTLAGLDYFGRNETDMKTEVEGSKKINISIFPKAYALNKVEYPVDPEFVPYSLIDEIPGKISENTEKKREAWNESIRKKNTLMKENHPEGISGFVSATAEKVLSAGKNENTVYSPVNVFLALSMLCETAEGESRQQLLNLLGCETQEELQKLSKDVFDSCYRNDGTQEVLLASSLWLDSDQSCKKDKVKTLAEDYYAGVYQGSFKDSGYSKEMKKWLNDNTGGLLKDFTSDFEFDPLTVMSLASTVYFKGKWTEEYDKTEMMTFHSPNGDIECEFMKESSSGEYYYSDKFSAIKRYFDNNLGEMWFILPDEGVSVNDLLSDSAALKLISGEKVPDSKYLIINQSIPKFDVKSDTDMNECMKSLGATDVFDENKADFSGILNNPEGVYLSKIEHAARVMIDEKGCTAAAYTEIALCGNAMPPEEKVDFVLDRPFIFVLRLQNGLTLFAGTVFDI